MNCAPFLLGAALFILLGLIPALGQLFASLPVSVGDAVLFVAYLQLFGSGLSLLGGLITADTIVADATDTVTGTMITGSAQGSEFVNLKVGGLVIATNTPPNTTVPLPGLGSLVVNEQVVPPGRGTVVVNGLHLFVTTANLLGLPVGTEIVVAHANARATPF